jgi:hypothetical protein
MLIKLWKDRNKILEGVANSVFKTEHVEEIHDHRMAICQSCPFLQSKGQKNCVAPGTHPCCPQCGCSLKFKLRSLTSSCPEGYWDAVLTQDEEDDVKKSIDNQNPL